MKKYNQLDKILTTTADMSKVNPRIICKDGESVSIQTGEYLYCSPRNDYGPWDKVEAGYPSCIPPISWKEYCEEWDKSFSEKLSSFWWRIKFSAEADFKYSKKGNKYINLIKGAMRGSRQWRKLFISQPCNTVYPYIPVEVVKEFIDIHGGEK